MADPGDEQRTGGGRPVKAAGGAEPGRSYFTALANWPDKVAGITRTELARRIDCGQSYLSELLSNSRSGPDNVTVLEWALKIIAACGGSRSDQDNWADYHGELITYQATGSVGPPPVPPEPGQPSRPPTAAPSASAPHKRSEAVSARFRRSPSPARADLATVVEDLAQTVTRRVRSEAEWLGLQDPWPLATQWAVRATPEALTTVNETIGMFFRAEVASGRLVILGPSGAGKSVATIMLVIELLEGRQPRDPVPVPLSIAGWNPAEQHLFDWLARLLVRDYPSLGRKLKSPTSGRETVAARLLAAGLILPVLDGLDTLVAELRVQAIGAINRIGDIPLIITSNTDNYEQIVRARGLGLARATVVELQPLASEAVRAYLRAAAPGNADRWEPVFQHWHDNPTGPLAQALQTPLMVWLARAAYGPPDTEPGQLCDAERFPDRESIEDHLLSHFVAVGYAPIPVPRAQATHAPRRVAEDDAAQWLTFLARHTMRIGVPDLAWWRLDRSTPGVAVSCRFLGGFALGFALGSTTDTAGNLVVALLVGLAATSRRYIAFMGVRDLETPHTMRFTGRWVRKELRHLGAALLNVTALWLGILTLVVVAVVVVVAVQVHTWRGMAPVVRLAALFLVGIVLVTWSLRRLRSERRGLVGLADLDRAVSPGSVLRDDRTVALFGAAPYFVAATVCLLFDFGIGVRVGIATGFSWLLISAYMRFTIARLILACRGCLPWHTMLFLEDAHKRGVLRQIGAIYEFRHQRLQETLATMAR